MPPTNYRAALETIPELGSLNVKPYYPTHFMRGTKIQLETGGVKNVEDMTARDFHMSGAVAEGLDIELSKVHSIEKASEGNVQTAKVVLIAGEVKARVTIQVFVEHPFFVIGMGWCSVNPTLTKARFGLDCQLLMAGHDCISLVKREDKRHLQPQPHHLNGGSRTATAEPSSTGQTPRRPSLPSTLSSSGNGTGSTSPASTSSVISRQGSMEGSVPPRSDLRSRIKTYQRQSPSAAPPLSQRSTVIRRPRRHRSVPPADPVELRRRAFDRKEKRGERKRRASVSCVKDSHGAFLRV
uniref:AXH domain-containing protein n=1 Tax=Steinernema glaseri TaxID=37863 RepID=A0A1I7ZJX4_9BILA